MVVVVEDKVVRLLGPTCKGAGKKLLVWILAGGAKVLLVVSEELALERYGRNWKGCEVGSPRCNWRLRIAGPPSVPPMLSRDLPSGLGDSLLVAGCQVVADCHVALMV